MSFSLNELFSGGPELTMGERAVSVVAGLFLTAAGARPRPNPVLNILALGAGSYLAYRGATGYCPLKAMLEEDRASARRVGTSRAGSGRRPRSPGR